MKENGNHHHHREDKPKNAFLEELKEIRTDPKLHKKRKFEEVDDYYNVA